MNLQHGLSRPELGEGDVVLDGLYHLLVTPWPGVLDWYAPLVVPGAVRQFFQLGFRGGQNHTESIY